MLIWKAHFSIFHAPMLKHLIPKTLLSRIWKVKSFIIILVFKVCMNSKVFFEKPVSCKINLAKEAEGLIKI